MFDAIRRDRQPHDEDHLSSAVEMIEAEIEEVEAELAELMPLVQRRHQLLTARAAILREPPPALLRR
jgi:hypothetical protein